MKPWVKARLQPRQSRTARVHWRGEECSNRFLAAKRTEISESNPRLGAFRSESCSQNRIRVAAYEVHCLTSTVRFLCIAGRRYSLKPTRYRVCVALLYPSSFYERWVRSFLTYSPAT